MIWLSAVVAARRLRRPFNLVLAGALAILVVLVLVVAAIGHARATLEQRAATRDVEGPDGVAASSQELRVGDRSFSLVMIWNVERADSALGVTASELPSPGRTAVSEALAEFLDDGRDAARLRARLPGEIEEGVPAGLTLGPREAVAFAVAPTGATPPEHVVGGHGGGSNAPVLLGVVALLLLLPASSMVIMAARFDGRSRGRLLRELRMIGAKARHLRLIATAESLVVALVGSLLGWVAWQSVRPLVASSGVAGTVLHRADLQLPVWTLLLAAAAVGLVSVAACVGAVGDALSVGSDGSGPVHPPSSTKRAVATMLAGVAVLHLAVAMAPSLDDVQLGLLEVVGLLLGLTGLLRFGPSLLAGVGRRLAGRRVSGLVSLLAGRRLEFEGAQAFRAASSVVVIGFAFGGFAALDLGPAAHGEPDGHSDELHLVELNGHDGVPLQRSLDAADLSTAAIAYRLVEHTSLIAIATCDGFSRALDVTFDASGCRENAAYATPVARHRDVGSEVELGEEVSGLDGAVEVVGRATLPDGSAALDGIDALIPVATDVLEHAEPTRLAAPIRSEEERLELYRAAAELAPLALVGTRDEIAQPDDGIERAGSIGGAVLLGSLLLAGASLALAAADAALRRRETTALLFAVGTPRGTRTRMAAAEVALPLAVAVVPALLLGFEMVFVGGTIVGGDVRMPWGAFFLAMAGTLAVGSLATALTVAAVRHVPTDAILRAEH